MSDSLVAGELSPVSEQPSTASFATTASKPSPVSATDAKLIDAALALNSQFDAADDDEPLVADHAISYETALAAIDIDDRLAPELSAGIVAGLPSLISHSERTVDDAEPWLGDELLEQVFG